MNRTPKKYDERILAVLEARYQAIKERAQKEARIREIIKQIEELRLEHDQLSYQIHQSYSKVPPQDLDRFIIAWATDEDPVLTKLKGGEQDV